VLAVDAALPLLPGSLSDLLVRLAGTEWRQLVINPFGFSKFYYYYYNNNNYTQNSSCF